MVPEHNAPYRSLPDEHVSVGRPGHQESVDGVRCAPAVRRSIDAIFDLNATGQAEILGEHRAGVGDDHHEVEPLGEGRVVLRMFSGGARRLQ